MIWRSFDNNGFPRHFLNIVPTPPNLTPSFSASYRLRSFRLSPGETWLRRASFFWAVRFDPFTEADMHICPAWSERVHHDRVRGLLLMLLISKRRSPIICSRSPSITMTTSTMSCISLLPYFNEALAAANLGFVPPCLARSVSSTIRPAVMRQ